MFKFEEVDDNPFTVSYGSLPDAYVDRFQITSDNDFLKTLNNKNVAPFSIFISGVRGSGKTVYMRELAKSLKSKDHWIIIEVLPELDLLEQILTKLQVHPELSVMSREVKFGLSIVGLSIETETAPDIGVSKEVKVVTLLENYIEKLIEQGYRLMICLDEIGNTKDFNNLRCFASFFNKLMGRNFPVFWVATGLPEDIEKWKSQKGMTFLYRSRDIVLSNLSEKSVLEAYQKHFPNVSEEVAFKMTKLVKGYAFAFQVVGYVMWKMKTKDLIEVLPEIKRLLFKHAYLKIWQELSNTNRALIKQISELSKDERLIEKKTKFYQSISKNCYESLFQKELIYSPQQGQLALTLPLFEEFVIEQ